ncbi:MAG: endolytic transglycosylase MltG [Candidatus Paceibacterota bacterium]
MENLSSLNELEHPVSKLNKKNAIYLLSIVLFLILFYFFFFSAPINFPVGSIVRIEKGSSLRSISLALKKQDIIRSRVIFESFVIIFGGELHIQSADYLFEYKLPIWQVAKRIVLGEHNMVPVSVTIPEGFNVNQIGDTFAKELTNFSKAKFLFQAKKLEGYLFPDTYFFLTTDNEKDVIESMSKNFEKKIAPLRPEIISSGKTEKNIIIMASIIEGEAKGDGDRNIISGILWKRISIGMPLQVDVAPETYKTKGLPESPIGNPGLDAIKASIHPQNSPYLYYLHDKDGNIYYAKTFGEHSKNIIKYLK